MSSIYKTCSKCGDKLIKYQVKNNPDRTLWLHSSMKPCVRKSLWPTH